METIAPVVSVLSWVLLASGSFFLLVGGVGLLRLPDFYSRTHAAGVIDTLGAGLIILGLMLQLEPGLNTFKLILIGFFIFFTSPTSSYAVAHAAWVAGQKPWTNNTPPAATNPSDSKGDNAP